MKKSLLSCLALVLFTATGWALADNTTLPKRANAEDNLVDLTEKIVNPQFDNSSTGWTVNKGKIEVKATNTSNPVVTAYNYQVDVSQNISGLEPGTYILKVAACSRHKDGKTGITDYNSKGANTPNEAYIYANGQQQKVKLIFEEGSTYDFASEAGQSASNLTLSSGLQIPYNSTNFAHAFGELGMYENQLEFTVGTDGLATIGIKNELSGSSYKPYLAYDNFRLYRVGTATDPTDPTDPEEPTEPEEPTDPEQPGDEDYGQPVELYDLHAPAGQFVAICMPYAVKSDYFGQVYTVGSITNGEALLVPVSEVATGVPCVVKSKGSSSITSATTNYNTKPTVFSLWDNTTMQVKGNFDNFTWTATDIYGNTLNASDLTFVEGDLKNLDFICSIENNACARYWAQHPDYKAEDESCIKNYYQLPVYNSSSRRDMPNPVLVPVVVSNAQQTVSYSQNANMTGAETVTVAAGKNVAEIYNLIPGTSYYYKSNDGKSAGKFTVGGAVRMMMIGTNVVNMRDLGGKQTADGRYVKYGKLYRSAEFKGSTYNINTEETNKLVALGIGGELDLRNTDGGTSRAWIPNLVNEDNYHYAKNSSIIANGPGRLYESSTISLLKANFEFLVANLRKGRAVQFHCRIGADRTGLFAFLALGILGVSEADILRDYETTSFSSAGLRTKEDGDGDSAASNYKAKVPTFRATASTFVGAFENYFLNTLKVSQTDIDDFRALMLGSSPLPAEAEAIEVAKATEAITENIEKAEDYNIGDEYGQYTIIDIDAFEAADDEVKSAKEVIATNPSLPVLQAQEKALEASLAALYEALELNMPRGGDRYYIRGKDGRYLSPTAVAAAANMPRRAAGDLAWTMVNDESDDCVFTASGDKIVHELTGYTFAPAADGSSVMAVSSDDEEALASALVPSVSGDPGSYNIKIGDFYLILPTDGNTISATTDPTDPAINLALSEHTGTSTAIETITSEPQTAGKSYNLLGLPVGDDYKGIVIRDGKKIIVR